MHPPVMRQCPDFSRSLNEGDRRRAEMAHKSSDGPNARDGFVTVSGWDFGVFRPLPRERPSAKSLCLGETRLTGGAVALGSWRFESSRPSSMGCLAYCVTVMVPVNPAYFDGG